MSRFIQLHVLTSYPPSNLNRDDTGRPKTAVIGDCTRLRISSQSLKRAWRTSDIFETALKGHIGTRTKEMGISVYQSLSKQGVGEKNAREWAKTIASQFGKLKSEKKTANNEDLHVEQLVHFNPEEEKAIDDLVTQLVTSATAPTEDDLKLLRKQHSAADIAMFGRMLASSPAFNTEAAIQVAHAITVHKAAVEDDYLLLPRYPIIHRHNTSNRATRSSFQSIVKVDFLLDSETVMVYGVNHGKHHDNTRPGTEQRGYWADPKTSG